MHSAGKYLNGWIFVQVDPGYGADIDRCLHADMLQK